MLDSPKSTSRAYRYALQGPKTMVRVRHFGEIPPSAASVPFSGTLAAARPSTPLRGFSSAGLKSRSNASVNLSDVYIILVRKDG